MTEEMNESNCKQCKHSTITNAQIWCEHKQLMVTKYPVCEHFQYEETETIRDKLQKVPVKVARKIQPITPSEAHHKYCQQEQPLKMTDKHDMAQVQSLELVDKWIEEAGNLSLNGVGTYTAWCHLTDSMREYKSAILLDLYDDDIIDLGGK